MLAPDDAHSPQSIGENKSNGSSNARSCLPIATSRLSMLTAIAISFTPISAEAAHARAALEAGAEGIGLFRTEFLFMDRANLPTEAEQYDAYREVSDLMADKEVIIRTLDVGGDKAIPYLGMEKEENPFLGHRAIRYCLDRRDVFDPAARPAAGGGKA